MKLQRRDFLKQAGLLSAASLLTPAMVFAQPSSLKAGIQLYTLREYIDKDVKGVLAKVAKAGYKEVETYGYSKEKNFWGLAPKEFKSVLQANGLTTPSGHYDMNNYFTTGEENDLQSYIEAAKLCGQTYIVIPYLTENLRKTTDDFKNIASKVNRMAELCKQANLKLAYHNHDFEFKPVDGVTLYDVLLKETDPALVKFELDLYWVVRAGKDPVKLMTAYPKRFAMWHVKDMDKLKPELNTEVGAGTIDFKKIFQSAKAVGITNIFVEQENFAKDPYQSIMQSATYIKKNLLA